MSALAVVVCRRAQRPCAAKRRRGRKAFDQLLDLYVRDGYVYYRALKSDAAKLDGYVSPAGDGIGRQAAARRADRVLAERLQRAGAADRHRSLSDPGAIDASYPPASIRQIPGAFERLTAPGRRGGR